MSPGTRIAPERGSSHSHSARRFKRARSMGRDSDVHDALGDPRAVLAARNRERGVGRSFHLYCRMMALAVDRLAPRGRLEPCAVEMRGETAEKKIARRHFVNDGVDPVGEEQFFVWRPTLDLDGASLRDARGIG